jgi:DNA sulfur modification protein DndE
MKTFVLSVLFLFSGISREDTANKITIFMIGDSTMAAKPLEDNPERGWGMMFQQFFDSTVIVENHAMNGRSTKTFISENRWQCVLDKLKPGDYVIIQFGHNDESQEKKDRYTPPEDYKRNLIKFVTETLSKCANPILCTPIMRRRFDINGKFYDTHGVYPDIVRHLADSLKVPLLDMHRKSEKLIEDAGVEGSKKLFLFIDSTNYKSLPHGRQDNTHFSAYGATKMAEIAIESLKELNIELKYRIKRKSF